MPIASVKVWLPASLRLRTPGAPILMLHGALSALHTGGETQLGASHAFNSIQLTLNTHSTPIQHVHLFLKVSRDDADTR